jgi:ribosomal protein L32
MEDAINEWFEELDGVASVPDVADFLELDVNYVRDFARENELPRVGANYVFRAENALDLWAEAIAEDEDSEEEESEEEESEEEESEDEDAESEDCDDEDDDDSVECSSCGETVLNASYCSSCGEALDDDEAEDEEEEEEAALRPVSRRHGLTPWRLAQSQRTLTRRRLTIATPQRGHGPGWRQMLVTCSRVRALGHRGDAGAGWSSTMTSTSGSMGGAPYTCVATTASRRRRQRAHEIVTVLAIIPRSASPETSAA